MTREDLVLRLANLESARVERTAAWKDTDKLGEAICAFANDLDDAREPGLLFVGATDDGRPSGLEITDELLLKLASIRSDGNLLPQPTLHVQKLDLETGSIAVVVVEPSSDTPVRYKGTVWVRVGPRRARANAEDERRLSEKRAARLARPWDSQPCGEATLDDLALELFALGYRRAAIDPAVIEENDRPLEHQLASLRFFDPGAGRPTHAGVLLFAKNPLLFVLGAYVQYVRYGGVDRASDVEGERRLSGDLGTVLRELGQLADGIAGGRPVFVDSFREVTIYDYPPRALREVFINAVIHRNYENSSAPIQIDHFADRLEVLNPGGLHPSLPDDAFRRATAYRNPVLAEAAKVLGFANRFGRGIAVVESELAANASPSAHFEPHASHFFVRIGRRP